MNLKGTIYVALHPRLALRTWAKQFAVRSDFEVSPVNVTIEDFAAMSLPEAMKRIKEAESSSTEPLFGGIPKEAWSTEDQQRMAQGELPHGHPEHPYV